MGEAVETAIRVRGAAAPDLDAVTALLRSASLPVEGVAERFDEGYAVAAEDGVVIGAAGIEVYGSYGLLRSVVVAEDARSRGVAAALTANRVEWARARGLRAIYLLTTTADTYFAKYGFASVQREQVPPAVRRSSEFAEVCPDTAAVMELRLVARVSSCCGGGGVSSAQSVCCAPAPTPIDPNDADALKAQVREKYGAAATRAASGAQSSCCSAAADEVWDPITTDLYDEAETSGLPMEAVLASLGCGNPTALAQLNEGEVVLDLGSGGGIDVLLSAKRVGPTGKAYGLDMTDEMLQLARDNQVRAGAANVEFLKGDIEAIPLPNESVDVIISNCVINLAADKGKVLREAFRVLKPGGRFAVSDIVRSKDVPAAIQRSAELWMGCVAGALHEAEYARLLRDAGFTNVSLEPTRIYNSDDARYFLEGAGLEVPAEVDAFDGAFISAFVRATKPVN